MFIVLAENASQDITQTIDLWHIQKWAYFTIPGLMHLFIYMYVLHRKLSLDSLKAENFVQFCLFSSYRIKLDH